MGLVEIIEADLTQPSQQQAVVTLTAAYAADRMGGGQPLNPESSPREGSPKTAGMAGSVKITGNAVLPK